MRGKVSKRINEIAALIVAVGHMQGIKCGDMRKKYREEFEALPGPERHKRYEQMGQMINVLRAKLAEGRGAR